MEATLGYTNEARPADRWAEAEKQRLNRKKYTNLVPGGKTENRARFREAITQAVEDKRAGNEAIYCPECGEIYSRGYMTRHRQQAHGTRQEPGKHCHYVQAVRPRTKSARPICPECGKVFQHRAIAPHRRAVHGAVTRQGHHDVVYRYTTEY